jgi:hypothetical protein
VTLLHELRIFSPSKMGNKVVAHGREWKTVFGQLLAQFIEHNVFPTISGSIAAIAAYRCIQCADEALLRICVATMQKRTCLCLEDVPAGTLFQHMTPHFSKRRTGAKRFRCLEVATKRLYLFSLFMK